MSAALLPPLPVHRQVSVLLMVGVNVNMTGIGKMVQNGAVKLAKQAKRRKQRQKAAELQQRQQEVQNQQLQLHLATARLVMSTSCMPY